MQVDLQANEILYGLGTYNDVNWEFTPNAGQVTRLLMRENPTGYEKECVRTCKTGSTKPHSQCLCSSGTRSDRWQKSVLSVSGSSLEGNSIQIKLSGHSEEASNGNVASHSRELNQTSTTPHCVLAQERVRCCPRAWHRVRRDWSIKTE